MEFIRIKLVRNYVFRFLRESYCQRNPNSEPNGLQLRLKMVLGLPSFYRKELE